MIRCAEVAAKLHKDMCSDDRNGYSWDPRWGGDHPDGRKTITIDGYDYSYLLGSMDCSSSVILCWRQAVKYTDYAGAFDDATYTGNMRDVFLSSGLFTANRTPAKRGDVYLNDAKHTAMCQDGGNDGVYGYDCLTQFSINEFGKVYGGQVGDQTGREAWMRSFYEYPWNTTLHYNGKADKIDIVEEKPAPVIVPVQKPGPQCNDRGIFYQAHCKDIGWCDPVRDGQTAGTEGFDLRMEALRINPPKGWNLFARLHIENVGWVSYYDIVHVDNIENAKVLGTTGESKQIESIIIGVSKRPKNSNSILRFRVYQEQKCWKAWTDEGDASGSDGLHMRLEGIQIMLT